MANSADLKHYRRLFYILRGRTVIPCINVLAWASWFETGKRQVALDTFGRVQVSTVFVGMDHSFGAGPPMVFETMIFGGAHDRYMTRCSTYAQAERMHAEAVAMVKPARSRGIRRP